MPVDPEPLIDDLTKTVEELTAKIAALKESQEKLSEDHAGKFAAALAQLKAALA